MRTGLRWFKFAISKVSDFRGRAGRSEFNWYVLFFVSLCGLMLRPGYNSFLIIRLSFLDLFCPCHCSFNFSWLFADSMT